MEQFAEADDEYSKAWKYHCAVDAIKDKMAELARFKPDTISESLSRETRLTELESELATLEQAYLASTVEAVTPAPVALVKPASADRTPLSMNQIANCFAGFHTNPAWEVPQWKKALGSPDKWLKACRHASGTPGRGGSESTWWPLAIAAALIKMDGNSERSLRNRFKNQIPLKPWFEQFEINYPHD